MLMYTYMLLHSIAHTVQELSHTLDEVKLSRDELKSENSDLQTQVRLIRVRGKQPLSSTPYRPSAPSWHEELMEQESLTSRSSPILPPRRRDDVEDVVNGVNGEVGGSGDVEVEEVSPSESFTKILEETVSLYVRALEVGVLRERERERERKGMEEGESGLETEGRKREGEREGRRGREDGREGERGGGGKEKEGEREGGREISLSILSLVQNLKINEKHNQLVHGLSDLINQPSPVASHHSVENNSRVVIHEKPNDRSMQSFESKLAGTYIIQHVHTTSTCSFV